MHEETSFFIFKVFQEMQRTLKLTAYYFLNFYQVLFIYYLSIYGFDDVFLTRSLSKI